MASTIDPIPNSRQRVLLISNSAVGPLMSGPGIRYWEFARVLSACPTLDVTLITTPGVTAQPLAQEPSFHLLAARDEADLCARAAQTHSVVAPGAVVSLYPSLLKVRTPLVLDLYVPLLLEELQRPRSHSLAEQAILFDRHCQVLSTQVLAADFILCASEKQKDYWLGVLSALGRINPYTHADDPALERLIAVVPFGLPARPPRHSRQVLKGIFPGIAADDKVLLWGGGLYDWLDAPPLIQAMAGVAHRRGDAGALSA